MRDKKRMRDECPIPENSSSDLVATFGAGCFWCIEAVFECIKGVVCVQSGFMGGRSADPTYEEVCTGKTGHAEVIQLRFDPGFVTYGKLLKIFWMSHDPTTLNQQGADIGTQYRSAIFHHSEEQRKQANKSKNDMNQSGQFDNGIVTEITRASRFYEADRYHSNYFRNNPNASYCQLVIAPKIAKLSGVLGSEFLGKSWIET